MRHHHYDLPDEPYTQAQHDYAMRVGGIAFAAWLVAAIIGIYILLNA